MPPFIEVHIRLAAILVTTAVVVAGCGATPITDVPPTVEVTAVAVKRCGALGFQFPQAAYSPDGKTIAITTREGSLRILGWSGKERARVFFEHGPGAPSFSPDGKSILVATEQFIHVRDVVDGHELWKVANPRPGYEPAFMPDGAHVVVGGAHAPRLLRAGDGGLDHDVPTADDEYYRLTPSPDGKLLAANTGSGLRLIRVDTGEFVHTWTVSDLGDGWISGLAFTPDSSTLVASLAHYPDYDGAPPSRPRAVAVRTSGDYGIVFALPVAATAQGGTASMALSADGSVLALALTEDAGKQPAHVELWRLRDKGTVVDVPAQIQDLVLSGDEYVAQMAIAPDAVTFAIADDKTVRTRFLGGDAACLQVAEPIAIDQSLSYSSDGKYFVTAGASSVSVFDGATLRPIVSLDDTAGRAAIIGDRVAVIARDQPSVRIVSMADGRELSRLARWTSSVTAIAASPDGATLVVAADDGIDLLRASDLAPVGHLSTSAHAGGVAPTALTISPDGRYIAATSGLSPFASPSLAVYRVSDGAALIDDVKAGTWGVAFSPDSRFIATLRQDGVTSLRVTDLVAPEADGGMKWSFRFNPWGLLTSIAWTPDGMWVLSNSAGTVARIPAFSATPDVMTTAGAAPSPVQQFPDWAGDWIATAAVAQSPDGKRMVIARFPNQVATELDVFCAAQ